MVRQEKEMTEFWINLAYFIATLICIGLPALALVYFDDDNAEMWGKMNREQLEKYIKSFGVTERRARKELNERYKLLKPLGFSDEKIFKVLVQDSPLDHRTLQAFHHRTKKIHGRSRKRIFKLLES